MRRNYKYRTNMLYLLIVGIFCFVAGVITISIGALIHAHPNVSFAALFKLTPIAHWVYGLL